MIASGTRPGDEVLPRLGSGRIHWFQDVSWWNVLKKWNNDNSILSLEGEESNKYQPHQERPSSMEGRPVVGNRNSSVRELLLVMHRRRWRRRRRGLNLLEFRNRRQRRGFGLTGAAAGGRHEGDGSGPQRENDANHGIKSEDFVTGEGIAGSNRSTGA